MNGAWSRHILERGGKKRRKACSLFFAVSLLAFSFDCSEFLIHRIMFVCVCVCMYNCTFTIRDWFLPVPSCIRRMLRKTYILLSCQMWSMCVTHWLEKKLFSVLFSTVLCVWLVFMPRTRYSMFLVWPVLPWTEIPIYLVGKAPNLFRTKKASKARSKSIPITWCGFALIHKSQRYVYMFLSMGFELCVYRK